MPFHVLIFFMILIQLLELFMHKKEAYILLRVIFMTYPFNIVHFDLKYTEFSVSVSF